MEAAARPKPKELFVNLAFLTKITLTRKVNRKNGEGYWFMDSRNSLLFLVPCILSSKNSIASTTLS